MIKGTDCGRHGTRLIYTPSARVSRIVFLCLDRDLGLVKEKMFITVHLGYNDTGYNEESRKRNESEGFYIPRLEKGMSRVLGSTSKKYAWRYLQLKVGHGAVGTYLAKIGVIETPQCWWCDGAEQTVEQLYVHYVPTVEKSKAEVHEETVQRGNQLPRMD